MAKAISGKQSVPWEEVVLAQAYELEARMNVLERRASRHENPQSDPVQSDT
jgi:hypothetical protein